MNKIKPIYKINSLQNKLLNSLNKLNAFNLELEYTEDPEIMDVDTSIEEEVPVSKEVKELIEYIREQKITRNIKYVVIHCTATQQTASVTSIINYWKNSLGWKSPGYHIIYKPKLGFTVLSDFNKPTNGVRGYNTKSIHLSYIGGVDKNNKPLDNRTNEQKSLIELTIKELKKILPPDIEIKGHRDFPNVAKACPSFNVSKEF